MNFRMFSIAGLVALWAVALYALATLPPKIPSSWGFDGRVSYGSKYILLLLPIIGLAVFVLSQYAKSRDGATPNLPFVIPLARMDEAKVISARYMTVATAELTIGFALIEATIVAAAQTGQLSPAFFVSIIGFSVVLLSTVGTMMGRLWRLAR